MGKHYPFDPFPGDKAFLAIFAHPLGHKLCLLFLSFIKHLFLVLINFFGWKRLKCDLFPLEAKRKLVGMTIMKSLFIKLPRSTKKYVSCFHGYLMSSYLCPYLMFNSRYLIEFSCLKECLNWQLWLYYTEPT